jgi:DNA-binding transcriptional LysR family regulator
VRATVAADLNDVKVLVTVVESQSFTAAGKLLGMPRSTVSRRVARLEKQLGARLLHRTTRRVRLTDVGEAYYERCARSLGGIHEAEAAVRAAQETPRGLVRLTSPVDVAEFLVPLFGEFLAEHPEVTVDVVMTERMVDLVGEGFDMALRAGSLSDSALIARRLSSDERRLYASPSYLERRGEPTTPQQLGEHDTIMAEPDKRSRRWSLNGPRGGVEVPLRPRLITNNYGAARAAAIAGAGIVCMPWFLAGEPLVEGTLRRVLRDYHTGAASLHLVYPTRRHLSAAVRALRDFLVTRLRELAPQDPVGEER